MGVLSRILSATTLIPIHFFTAHNSGRLTFLVPRSQQIGALSLVAASPPPAPSPFLLQPHDGGVGPYFLCPLLELHFSTPSPASSFTTLLRVPLLHPAPDSTSIVVVYSRSISKDQPNTTRLTVDKTRENQPSLSFSGKMAIWEDAVNSVFVYGVYPRLEALAFDLLHIRVRDSRGEIAESIGSSVSGFVLYRTKGSVYLHFWALGRILCGASLWDVDGRISRLVGGRC